MKSVPGSCNLNSRDLKARRRLSWSLSALCLGLWLCPGSQAYTLSTLTAFSSAQGGAPAAGVVLGANGLFYGATSQGGAWNDGTLFVLDPAGGVTNLAVFDGTNGAQCLSPLVQGRDGNFYGTTFAGGDFGVGTVFVLNPAGGVTKLASFDGMNGSGPKGALAVGRDGTLYGTTFNGGDDGSGTVYQLSVDGRLTRLFSFNGTNGSHPCGALVVSGNSTNVTLYGTTAGGGAFAVGTAFALNLVSNTLTTLHAFAGPLDGSGPQGGLVSAGNAFYGTTASGGTNGGYGTLFRISSSGSFTNLYSFDRTNGSVPSGTLIQGADSSFYGTTVYGGASGSGTVFCFSSSNTLTVLRSFSGGNEGGSPGTSLAQGTDGNLYGTTSTGGRNGQGTVFELSGFAPTLLSVPNSQTVQSGTTVQLSVHAIGSLPLVYQWQRNSNNIASKGSFSGATTASLTLSNAMPANSGTYQVIVRNSSSAVTSAPISLTVVDYQPVVRISSPSRGAKLSTRRFTISGTAGGAQPVEQVFYQLNGGGWQPATLGGNGTRWQAAVMLSQGSNWIQAYGINAVGFSSVTNPVGVGCFCGLDGTPVSVEITGSGTVSPNYDQTYLATNKFYRMTATPAAGYLFSNWTATVSGAPYLSTNSATLSFSNQPNLVIQAAFIPNPFLGISGAYSGLFFKTNAVEQTNCGAFSFTLTAKGACSGTIQTDGGRYSMSGRFDMSGSTLCTIKRRRASTLYAALNLDFSQASQRVAGVISNSDWSADLSGDKAVYNGKTMKAPQAGAYTFVLPGAPDSVSEPAGDGWGTVMVDNSGRVSLAGSLADGTKISQSATVATNSQWPLYVSLYGNKGSLMSWATLSARPGETNSPANWFKPPVAKAAYSNGFATQSDLLVASYQRPGGKTNVLAWASGILTLSGGAVSSNAVVLLPNNVVSNVAGPKLRLTIKPANGSFAGTVVDPSTGKSLPFTGVVLENGNEGRGYYLRNNLSGVVQISGGAQN